MVRKCFAPHHNPHKYAKTLSELTSVKIQAKAEALKNIEEVVQMIVEEILEDQKTLPTWPRDEVTVFPEPRVAVAV